MGLWSLFINVLIKSMCIAIHSVLLTSIDFNEQIKIIFYILIAILTPFFICLICNSYLIKNIMNKISKRTWDDDIFKDVIDYNKRTMMILYLKNSDIIYSGIFKLREQKGANSNICLIKYSIIKKESNVLIRKHEDIKSSVIINLQDVERVELVYEDDSEVWKWLNKDNQLENIDTNQNKKRKKITTFLLSIKQYIQKRD